ncbi:hypothetical protein M758_1G302700 [Ceratodon purpureus]|uniref:Peroxidase n=1 Tax=Ceratodon purpureus TaxID=3225 RepID=A0A8T0JDT4_CERPU|nr:hypothetical protein KC19_1G308900 [Ceratodon purpureus]KAG0593174.1 hypothetical protein KC19_1G308900 [Ceratodon purpureus]KAG0632084.1 hypothetical protein M758_1G302700 [Ceratodon purpureus]
MAMASCRAWLLVVLCVMGYLNMGVNAQFFNGFYRTKDCANAEAIVQQAVTEAFNQDPSVAPSLIRMLFHDCFVEGCDGSLLLDPTPQNPNVEKKSGPNLSVRGYDVIDAAKTQLEKTCPQTVSCADIVALAARDSVVLTGGKHFDIPTGRLDGLVSSTASADANLVSTDSSAQELTQKFLAQGLGQDEMITLSGAHTVGRTSCAQITSRLYNFPGSTTGADPALDVDYAHHLQQLCPQNGNPNVIVPLDPVSPNTFDNMYYTNGVTGRVMFASDNALFLDHQTEFASNLNSQNGEFWQVKFANALVHMASNKIKQGRDGEIRQNCRFTNAGLAARTNT